MIEEIGDNDTVFELSQPQSDFILSDDTYPLFLAGMGSGKSLTMCLNILMDLDLAYGVRTAAYAPTYDLLRLITIPYLEELLEGTGAPYKLNKTENIFYLEDDKKIICRSMDNPVRIVGYEVFRSHIDELDVLNKRQAALAWNKIVARNRQKIYDYDGNELKNRVNAYTTPEGFQFCYDKWGRDVEEAEKKGYRIFKAATMSNAHNLPHDYIQNLRDTFPEQLIEAYLNGDFVNMESGSVYPKFDRKLNHCDDVVERGDQLHVGMDFNVHKMAAGIHVIRNNQPRAVDEITDGTDTPDVCEILKERYPKHHITVYPDASGNGTSSKSASKSDISIIKSYGFKVKAKSSNPRVKDRIKSVNAQICNGKGERKYKINTKMCPNMTESLEQQIYGPNGEPDKKSGHDHHSDEIGYFLHYNWPIIKRSAKVKSVKTIHR